MTTESPEPARAVPASLVPEPAGLEPAGLEPAVLEPAGLGPAGLEPAVLELDGVTYRRESKEILHGISFTVRAGEHWALLGPNGAGKSTVLGFCGAVTHPTSGTVRVLGEQLGRVELARLRRLIGHVNPRHPLRSPLTIREVVLTGLTGSIESPLRWQPALAELDRADALIKTLGLSGRAGDRWPTLSQGERGRSLIARALIGEPRLLLLDEPATGLDLAAREQLLETIDLLDIAHPGTTSILVTHHLEELPASTTHALLIAAGRVVAAGPVGDVITTANVSAAFDYPIEVRRDEGRWAARAATGAPRVQPQLPGSRMAGERAERALD